MNEIPPALTQNSARKERAFHPVFLLPALAALPLAVIYMMLIGSYWYHYEMGASGGNGFALLFLYGPTAFVLFLGSAAVGWLLVRRFGGGPWLGALFSFVAMLLVFVCAVTYEVRRTANYPTDVKTPFGEFVRGFIRTRLKL
jgi:hypothetical protein